MRPDHHFPTRWLDGDRLQVDDYAEFRRETWTRHPNGFTLTAVEALPWTCADLIAQSLTNSALCCSLCHETKPDRPEEMTPIMIQLAERELAAEVCCTQATAFRGGL